MVVQVVGRVGNLALGVIATAVLARGLGKYGYGQWATILLIPALLSPLNELGFLQVAVRHASSEDDPRWLGALVTRSGGAVDPGDSADDPRPHTVCARLEPCSGPA